MSSSLHSQANRAYAHLQALHLCHPSLHSLPDYNILLSHEEDRQANRKLHTLHSCTPPCNYRILVPSVLYHLTRRELETHASCLLLNPSFTVALNACLPPNRSFDLRLLIRSPFVKWKHLLPYLWSGYIDIYYLCRHKDVDIQFLYHHATTYPWYWKGLSRNHHIPFWFILKYNDLPWDWREISEHRVTLSIVLSFRRLPWDWAALSRNPTLTWSMVAKYPTLPWVYKELMWNPFSHQYAAKVIQRAWRLRKRRSSCL